MSIIYLLVPLAIVLAALATVAFVWSARSGQLDDLVTPALRMLSDDQLRQPRRRVAPRGAPQANVPNPADHPNANSTSELRGLS